jgi:hypothetical protein
MERKPPLPCPSRVQLRSRVGGSRVQSRQHRQYPPPLQFAARQFRYPAADAERANFSDEVRCHFRGGAPRGQLCCHAGRGGEGCRVSSSMLDLDRNLKTSAMGKSHPLIAIVGGSLDDIYGPRGKSLFFGSAPHSDYALTAAAGVCCYRPRHRSHSSN